MSLLANYVAENGYDYFGNAAEDTLVFFVHDEEAPSGEASSEGTTETITNVPGDTVNGSLDSLPTDTTAAGSETGAQAYGESKGDSEAGQPAAESNNSEEAVPASGSDDENEDTSTSVPHLAPVDDKQTEADSSGFKN